MLGPRCWRGDGSAWATGHVLGAGSQRASRSARARARLPPRAASDWHGQCQSGNRLRLRDMPLRPPPILRARGRTRTATWNAYSRRRPPPRKAEVVRVFGVVCPGEAGPQATGGLARRTFPRSGHSSDPNSPERGSGEPFLSVGVTVVASSLPNTAERGPFEELGSL